MGLEWLEITVQDTTFDRVLDALSDAVRESSRRIDKVQKSDDWLYVDAIVDDECDFTEQLLGAAFVVAQAKITEIAAKLQKLHHSFGQQTQTTDGRKIEILDRRPPTQITGVSGASYSIITAINAFANYFKHNDEWPYSWAEAGAASRATVWTVLDLGLSEHSTGNLRRASEVLGNGAPYTNLVVLRDVVEAWGRALHEDLEGELQSLRLI